MKKVWIFEGGYNKSGLFRGDIFIHLGLFLNVNVSFLCILGSVLKVKVQNGGYFLGC